MQYVQVMGQAVGNWLYSAGETILVAAQTTQLVREAFKKEIWKESWDIVPTGRGGTLSHHISVPTKKITCSE